MLKDRLKNSRYVYPIDIQCYNCIKFIYLSGQHLYELSEVTLCHRSTLDVKNIDI